MLNDKEILTFFNYIDTDNSGDCSMQEMLAGCLPKHFTSKPWWEKSRERQNIIDNIKKEHERAMHRENRCTHPTLTTSALMKEIRVKVEQTASKGSDQIRQMLIRFKKPSGTSKAYTGPANRQVSVDIARFYNQVKLLGITMTEEQVCCLQQSANHLVVVFVFVLTMHTNNACCPLPSLILQLLAIS